MEKRITMVQDVKNVVEIKHRNYKIDRQIAARREDLSIILGGLTAAGAMEGVNRLSLEFLGTPALQGWTVGTIVLFILYLIGNSIFRQLWWKGNDAIYDSEK